MKEQTNMIIKQELSDKLLKAQVALFTQIETKQRTEGAIVTQEEADFASIFVEYAKVLTDFFKQQI